MVPRHKLSGSLFACSLLASIASAASVLAAAQSADDICPPSVDPCVISQPFVVESGATLDFGTRAVRIVSGGQLDIGAGAATIQCGSFSSETGTAVGLKVRGPNTSGETVGGDLVIEAMRTCVADPAKRCAQDEDCAFGTCDLSVCELDRARVCSDDAGCSLGTCGVAVCTGNPDHVCTDDAECDAGPCNLSTRRCANDSGRVCFSNSQCSFGSCALGDLRCSGATDQSCATDADCQKGACSVDVCTVTDAGVYRECSVDADCAPGPCAAGDGGIRLGGRTRADGVSGGSVRLRAAGDVEIEESMQLQSMSREDDGGVLRIDSFGGSIRFSAPIDLSAEGAAYAGEILARAREDVTVEAPIDLSGGWTGGLLDIIADRDVLFSDTVVANAAFGDGDGGDVYVDAARDIVFDADARVLGNGHTSADNVGGWGGLQDYVAGRTIFVAAAASLEAHGAAPNGVGGEIWFESGADTTVAGTLLAKSAGTESGGGVVDIQSWGRIALEDSSVMSVVGGTRGEGLVRVRGVGDVRVGGVIDARMPNDGTAGDVRLEAGGDLTVDGDVLVAGTRTFAFVGRIILEGCGVRLERGAMLGNYTPGATNTLTARDRIEIDAGASLLANTDASNVFVYRDAVNAPIVAGHVTPAYQSVIDATLEACPVCGNALVERGESCEDGNLTGGDGCSADCQDEGCIAATPGYPATLLCSDGDPCTADRCDPATHACSSEPACDDGDACTVDTCDPVDGCLSIAAPVPDSLCVTAARSSLRVKNPGDPAQADLVWRWGKGGAFDHAALGAPDTSTAYSLCVYDMTAATPSLAASIDVAPSSRWQAMTSRGWDYTDTRAESDGVRKLRLAAGAASQTKASVAAHGAHLPLAPAKGLDDYFDVDPRVVAQLVSSDGMCLTSDFAAGDVQRNDATRFKASSR
jgi:cysteine-rich repeat protein